MYNLEQIRNKNSIVEESKIEHIGKQLNKILT